MVRLVYRFFIHLLDHSFLVLGILLSLEVEVLLWPDHPVLVTLLGKFEFPLLDTNCFVVLLVEELNYRLWLNYNSITLVGCLLVERVLLDSLKLMLAIILLADDIEVFETSLD